MPFLFAVVGDYLKAVFLEHGADFVLPPLNYAGAYEHRALGHKLPHIAGEGDDNVGDDVCEHKLIPAAKLAAQGRVADNIAA